MDERNGAGVLLVTLHIVIRQNDERRNEATMFLVPFPIMRILHGLVIAAIPRGLG